MRKLAQFMVLAAAMAMLSACVTRPYAPAASFKNLPTQVELIATPFFPQDEHQCGPAALATVLGAAGYETSPRQLEKMVYLPAREGSLQAEMLGGARRQGALTLLAPTQLDALFAEVATGQPVLVLQNLGLNAVPRWHYAALVGYDLIRGEVILRSGISKREIMSIRTFEHTWARSDHWGLLVLAPGKIPLKASRHGLETALTQQEPYSHPEHMAAWYQSAAQRWPDSLLFMLGLGNAMHAAGRLDEAEDAFRTAVARHADSPVALNNLAHVLNAKGKLEQALAVAEQAVSLGGEWQPQALATRDAILGAIRQGAHHQPAHLH